MTNFESIKNWNIKQFSEFTIGVIINTLKFAGIDSKDIDVQSMIEDYEKWLNAEVINYDKL